MTSTPQSSEKVRHRLQIHFEVHHRHPTEEELSALADDTDSLAVQVGNFPQADLRVLLEWNSRSNDYSVKLTLILPGETFVGSDRDPVLGSAFERCLIGLEANVKAYKERMGQVPERKKQEKGTYQELTATGPVDVEAVEDAVLTGDYAAFRTGLGGYEDGLRARLGRWVERYPVVAARLGQGLEIADLIEEVYLAAFEGFESRPDVRLGAWLEGLIDPAVKAIQDHPDEEMENINMARTAFEATG